MEGICVSLEEMAYLLEAAQEGQGGGFLRATLGKLGEEEMRGRLVSAAHSLLARQLLRIESEKIRVVPALQTLLLHLLHSNYTLRIGKTEKGEERLRTYFFSGQDVVEESVDQGVVVCLRKVDREHILPRTASFLSSSPLQCAHWSTSVPIPVESLESGRAIAEEGREQEAQELFVEAGVASDIAQGLANALSNAQWRASIVSMRSIGPQIVADRVLLLLQSSTLWAFQVIASENIAHLIPCQGKTLEQILSEWLSTYDMGQQE